MVFISQQKMVGGSSTFDCVSYFVAVCMPVADVPRGFMYMHDELDKHARCATSMRECHDHLLQFADCVHLYVRNKAVPWHGLRKLTPVTPELSDLRIWIAMARSWVWCVKQQGPL